MKNLRTCSAIVVLVSALIFSGASLRAALPDYKLGDVATEDVVTPVALLVVNPEGTEALKQKVAQQVPSIVRRTTSSLDEAETELRASAATARVSFMATLQLALNGRAPTAADVDSPEYASVLREVGGTSQKRIPLARFAPLWLQGASDEALIASLLQPIREIMAQPIVGDKSENPLPPNVPVRVISVQNLEVSPGLQELETAGVTITVGKVLSLSRARRVVETYFPSGQAEMGRFAATFVRINAYSSPGLSDLLRAKRMEGVTVNDSYEAAQVIVKKGQVIDRKALGALAAVREKSLIVTLQTKLEQNQSVAGQISRQTKWIAVGLGALGLALALILWRLRARPSNALVLSPLGLPGAESRYALPGGEDDWRNRAMIAEGKARRAQDAIRTGALGWMREKIFQTLFRQRAQLLSAQQKAEAEMHELEQRLEQLHTPLQERITAYERRIVELEQELAAKGEENRELIGARITVAKQQLHMERGRFGIN